MPLSNLQNLVNTPQVHEARFHLGYSASHGYPHLILVGVDSIGKSMISSSDHIYDFGRPCPPLCGSASIISGGASTSSTSSPTNPPNTISSSDFNTWKTAWQTHWDDQFIDYFTMELSNLQNLINTPQVYAARLYLGYSANDGQPHLVLVGVDHNGDSMIGTSDHIYNLAKLCPSNCPD